MRLSNVTSFGAAVFTNAPIRVRGIGFAMSLSLLGLRNAGIEITNPSCVAKTPRFRHRPRQAPMTNTVAVRLRVLEFMR
jgi:hypothetical protein